MGVCLSRCGDDAHQLSVVVTATDSHENSLEMTAAASSYDLNHSFKRFLCLHADGEPKKSSFSSTPRTSLTIPHSSELFSLPSSEHGRRSSSGDRGTTRASVSSHLGCQKNKIRPARGGLDLAAHQRLADAIARLERRNDGKSLGLPRGSSFELTRRSTSHVDIAAPNARSCELQRSATTRSRRVPRHPLPKSGNLAAPTPAIKPMPLEKSVTNFLREVEHFVALIDAPRLSSSSSATNREPAVITTTVTNRRLSSYPGFEDTDSDEMFTFFESSSEESHVVQKKQQSPVRKPSVAEDDDAAESANRRIVRREYYKLSQTCARRSSPRALTGVGLRRGLARSLGSTESSVIHVDDLLPELSSNPLRATQLLGFPTPRQVHCKTEATLIDAKMTEFGNLIPVSSTLSFEQEQSRCGQKEQANNCITECLAYSTTAEVAALEVPAQEVSRLVETRPSAQTNHHARCEERLSIERTKCTAGDSQRFLSKAFNSLLKLLSVSHSKVQADAKCTAPHRDPDEENQ